MIPSKNPQVSFNSRMDCGFRHTHPGFNADFCSSFTIERVIAYGMKRRAMVLSHISLPIGNLDLRMSAARNGNVSHVATAKIPPLN
jgi:hypothetical protein